MEHSFCTLKTNYEAYCNGVKVSNAEQRRLAKIGAIAHDEAQYEHEPSLGEYFLDWGKTHYAKDLDAFKKLKISIDNLASCGLISYDMGNAVLVHPTPCFLGYMYNFIISKWKHPSCFVQDISTHIRLPEYVLNNGEAINILLTELIENADRFDQFIDWELSCKVSISNLVNKLPKAA